MTRRPAAAALLALVVALASSCGGNGDDGSGGGAAPASLEAEQRTETLVDTSRPTPAAGNQPAQPSRTLVSEIFFPSPPKRGGYPLVVFGHGNTSNPGAYRVLLEAWAAAGYVVAAPTFPLSSTTFRSGPANVVNQPADVSFVIGEMLRLSGDGGSPYAGRVDPDRIAVAGHSLGAETILASAANSCCKDPRIKAAIVLAGAGRVFENGMYFPGGAPVPLLVVHGEADTTIQLAEGERVFNPRAPPKVMLILPTSDLPSTDHVGPFVGGGQRGSLVTMTTVGFLDRYLGDRADALGPVRTAVDAEVGYRLQIFD